MPTLILKFLALSGVISAGCFAVWKANSELQPSDSVDQTHFTAVEGEPQDSMGLGGQPILKSTAPQSTTDESEPAEDKSLALGDPAFANDEIEEESSMPRGMPSGSQTDLEETLEQTEPVPGIASLEALEAVEKTVPVAPVSAAKKSPAAKSGTLSRYSKDANSPALITIPDSGESEPAKGRMPARIVPVNAEVLGTTEPEQLQEDSAWPTAPGAISAPDDTAAIVTAANEIEETLPANLSGDADVVEVPDVDTDAAQAPASSGRSRSGSGDVPAVGTNPDREINPFDNHGPELESEPSAVEAPSPVAADPVAPRHRPSMPTPVENDSTDVLMNEPGQLKLSPNHRAVRTPTHTHAVGESLDTSSGGRTSIPSKTLPSRTVTPEMLSGDATIDDPLMPPTQQPQLRIEKKAQAEAEVGVKFIYEIIVQNIGPAPAQYVVVEERIPKGCDMKRSQPQATYNLREKILRWDLGTMAPNDKKVIQVEVIPTEAGPVGSVATVRFAAQVATKTVVTAPTLKLEIQNPPEVAVGEQVPVKFTITNTGSGTARKSSLRAILEEGLTHPRGLDIEKELGTLSPNESKVVELTLTATQAGPFAPSVTIYTNGIDKPDGTGYTGGIEQENRTLKLSVIDSRIKITREGHVRRFVNRPADFITTVKNQSIESLTNVRITEQLPEGVTPVGEPGKAVHWNPENHTVSWSVSELRPGEHTDLKLSVVSSRAGTLLGKVQAVADSGHRAELETELEVQGFSSLTLDFQGDGKTVAVGDQVSMKVTVGNKGSAPAKKVQTQFELPPQMKFLAAKGPVKFTEDGRLVTFDTIDELAHNSDITFDIVLIAAEEGRPLVGVELLSSDLPDSIHQQEAVTIIPQ